MSSREWVILGRLVLTHWNAAGGVSAAVNAAKGIIQSWIRADSATAAADCNALDWPVSHYTVDLNNMQPATADFAHSAAT